MRTIKTIYHSKCKDLFREIKETDGLFFYDEDGDYYDDELGGLNQCIIDAYADLEYHYSGAYDRMVAEDQRYARSEQIACNNW